MILRIPEEIGTSLGAAIYLAGKKDIVEYLQVLIENDFLNKDFSLSEKGKKIFKTIETDEINNKSLMELAIRYRNCFKDPTGKALKPGATGNLKLLVDRLKEFKEEYPQYSDDHIIKAISSYVKSTAADGFKYLQQAHYTIKKTNKDRTSESRLLTFCEEIDINDDESLEFGLDV